MKGLFIAILFFVFRNAYSQKDASCEGLKTFRLKVCVRVNNQIQTFNVRKAELSEYGLKIALSDSSYKVTGFTLSYDCHSRALMADINAKAYEGNTIKPGDPFLKGVWVGDTLVLECIRIEKNGKRFVVQAATFMICE